MSKTPPSCGHCSHNKAMNKIDKTKMIYNDNRSKQKFSQQKPEPEHFKQGEDSHCKHCKK